MTRVVLDTNIFISAVLGGRLGVIIDEWKAGKVNFIVSGDNHLLELKSFREIPIITAREFISWLETQ